MNSSLREIRDYWDGQWSGRPVNVNESSWAAHFIVQKSMEGKVVIEVGPGANPGTNGFGWYSQELFKARRYIGVDISLVALQRSKFRNYGLDDLVNADATNLPFKKNSSDLVLSVETLVLLGKSAPKAIREMARVSRESVLFSISHEDLIRNYAGSPCENTKYGVLAYIDHPQKLMGMNESSVKAMLESFNMDIAKMEVLTADDTESTSNPSYVRGSRGNFGNLKTEILVEAVKRTQMADTRHTKTKT